MSQILNNARLVLSTSTSTGLWDLSPRTMKLELPRDADEHDDTVMSMTAHSRVIGLEKWSFKTTLLQSFTSADGSVNTNTILNTLYAYSKAGNKFLVTVRYDNSLARGVSNPEWSGLCVLKNYSPLVGSVGDLQKTDVEFLGSGNLSEVTTSS